MRLVIFPLQARAQAFALRLPLLSHPYPYPLSAPIKTMFHRRKAFNSAILECTHPGCSQTFHNKSGLMQHVRIPHPSTLCRPNASPAPESSEPDSDNADFPGHNQDEVETNQAHIIIHPIINGMHLHLGASIEWFTSELLY